MVKAMLKGKKVRRILMKKNKSQNWLAQKLGISSGYIAQLLNGDRNPSPEVRQLFLDFFDECEFDDLFSIKV